MRKAERLAYQQYKAAMEQQHKPVESMGSWLAHRYDRILQGVAKSVHVPYPVLDPTDSGNEKDYLL